MNLIKDPLAQEEMALTTTSDETIGGRWVRTRKCGCGNCRYKPVDFVCPKVDAKDATWLWAHTYSTQTN